MGWGSWDSSTIFVLVICIAIAVGIGSGLAFKKNGKKK